MRTAVRSSAAWAVAATLCLAAGTAAAQPSPRGCTAVPRPNPPGQTLVCADGLTVATEAGSDVRLVDRDRDGRPEKAELVDRGLLVESPAGTPRPFQILTPHAIASVRGTVWAVDVSAERTSVFVQRGAVSVRRQRGRGVVLRAGEGVDVNATGGALEVKRWSPERASALLARFGR